MNCSKCGAPVTGDVCPYCGSPTYITGPEATNGQQGYEENEWYDVPDTKPEPEVSQNTYTLPDTSEPLTTQQNSYGQPRTEKFYFQSWFVIAMLFVFPLIGLILMYAGKKWSPTVRLIITILVLARTFMTGSYYANVLGGVGGFILPGLF